MGCAVCTCDLAQARGDVLAIRQSPEAEQEHCAEDSERWPISPGGLAVLAATRCRKVLLGHAARDLRENQHRRRPRGVRIPDGRKADGSSFPSAERVVLAASLRGACGSSLGIQIGVCALFAPLSTLGCGRRRLIKVREQTTLYFSRWWLHK